MIVDGRAIAKEVIARAKARAAALPSQPSFCAFVVAPTPATHSYLKVKGRQAEAAGIRMEVKELPESATTEELVDAIRCAKEDALIVQLPLPEQLNLMTVLEAIPLEKDADVLSPHAREGGLLMHPVAASVKDILDRAAVSIVGARVTVVGQGWLVGQPVAEWLKASGAVVTTVTRESGDLEKACKNADIIISGVGTPGLIKPEFVPQGASMIDIGTSELGGSIAGDVDPKVAEIAGLFTPVPGGVGPIAVAYLMENVVSCAQAARLHTS